MAWIIYWGNWSLWGNLSSFCMDGSDPKGSILPSSSKGQPTSGQTEKFLSQWILIFWCSFFKLGQLQCKEQTVLPPLPRTALILMVMALPLHLAEGAVRADVSWSVQKPQLTFHGWSCFGGLRKWAICWGQREEPQLLPSNPPTWGQSTPIIFFPGLI